MPTLTYIAGRLFQQYLCDVFCRVDFLRLKSQEHRQRELRAKNMAGLIDHVRGERLPDNVEDDVGRQILSPASHTGYPRDLHRRYLNAMAMVAVAGKPDLFITFTCNPRWPEIQSALGPHDTANDRPDILARVFAFKFKQFLQDVYAHSAFGAVEFQKRGLPHAHLLVILVDKVTAPEQVDRITSAELPDPVSQLHLYTAVCKHMMPGPCGDQNPKCPCMRNGVCRWNYPRPPIDCTTVNPGTYATYRRRHTGIRTPQGCDSGWVVPYNPVMLLRYDCHLNVEISTCLKTVNYIFKYVHKGPDRAVNPAPSRSCPCTCQGSNSSTSERARQKRHYRN